ncbi:MAG: SIS domain-containing protein, partial [Firmicutes bacterium]|nr:SIS domain-containing protein [Bacillota bacterium]
ALQLFKSKGLFTVAICNTQHSSICRYSNMSLPTKAGQEIAVASTKAFIAQALVGEVVAAHVLGKQVDFKKYIVVAKDIVKKSDEIKSIAKKYKDIKKMFFLGKGLTTVIANESALKVKEITYKHAEGIAAGELKHGTLALVDSDTLSIVLVPEDEKAAAKIKNSESEVRSRDSHVWEVPPTPSCLAVMYAQLFALHKTYFMGLDPDKPRNLAKSVTVE